MRIWIPKSGVVHLETERLIKLYEHLAELRRDMSSNPDHRTTNYNKVGMINRELDRRYLRNKGKVK
jgi:hypothetical protein